MTHENGTSGGVGSTGGSAFLSNLHHMCAQTDGTYRFPNSREGDMLKTAKREIEELRSLLQQMLDVAENADETGYVTDAGFVDLDELHTEVRAILSPNHTISHTQK